jgi:hypothetical protein
MYLRICGSQQKIIAPVNPQIATNRRKIYGSQIRKWPHLRKVCKSKKIKARKFMDLRFAELIYGTPTFAKLT